MTEQQSNWTLMMLALILADQTEEALVVLLALSLVVFWAYRATRGTSD